MPRSMRSPERPGWSQRYTPAPFEHRRSKMNEEPYPSWERESRGQDWAPASSTAPVEAIAKGRRGTPEDVLPDCDHRVMISNVPLDLNTLGDIKQYFKELGPSSVVRFTPEMDTDGMATGLGIVTFKNSNFARQALLKFNNRPLGGRIIHLDEAPQANSAPIQVDQGALQARMFTVTDVPSHMDAEELVGLLSHSVAMPIHIRLLREINIAIVAMKSDWHCQAGQELLNHFFWNGYELHARDYDPTLDIVLGR